MTYSNLNRPKAGRQTCLMLYTTFLLAGPCVLRLFLAVPPLRAAGSVQAPGNELVGTYRVEQVIDLGSEVRVTLHIRLINNTPQELEVIDLTLRDLHLSSRPVPILEGTRLQPREGTTVEHEFVVSRAEYASWSQWVRPTLEVRLQPSEGREVRRTIQLVRLDAGRRP